jgi:hypothetical protein
MVRYFLRVYTRGFRSLVASTAALIATGRSEPVPGRVYPRCGPPPFHGAPDCVTYGDLTVGDRRASLSDLECHIIMAHFAIWSRDCLSMQQRLVVLRHAEALLDF